MFETNQFKLPMLQASQAQKHVTVNEAIARLDAVAQLRLESLMTSAPPSTAIDGTAYYVASPSSGEWFGQEGNIAIYSNGGWVFLVPKEGWRAWVVDSANEVQLISGTWQTANSGGGQSSLAGPLGSSFGLEMLEFEHVVMPSANNSTLVQIPAGAMVALVGFRISEEIVTDGATNWRLGISNSVTRYGSSYDLGLNESNVGGGNKTMFYYPNAKSLYLSVPSGNFVSGKVIFTLYLLTFGLPNTV